MMNDSIKLAIMTVLAITLATITVLKVQPVSAFVCNECAKDFAPGQEAISPGDASNFAPGHQANTEIPAKDFAPGQLKK